MISRSVRYYLLQPNLQSYKSHCMPQASLENKVCRLYLSAFRKNDFWVSYFFLEKYRTPKEGRKAKNSFPSHKTFYHIDNQEWIFFKGIANVSPAGLSFCETFFLQLQIKWKLFIILKFLGRSFLIWWLQVWTDFHKICASKELFLVQRHFKVFFWLIR